MIGGEIGIECLLRMEGLLFPYVIGLDEEGFVFVTYQLNCTYLLGRYLPLLKSITQKGKQCSLLLQSPRYQISSRQP